MERKDRGCEDVGNDMTMNYVKIKEIPKVQ